MLLLKDKRGDKKDNRVSECKDKEFGFCTFNVLMQLE